MIIAEFRRTPFSERADIRPFEVGATIADIVAMFDTPPEFEEFGAVYLRAHDGEHLLFRESWHRVRPRDGAALFVSCIPQDGGSSSGGKDAFKIVGAIALIVITAGVAGGGLAALLGPAFAAGQTGAIAAGLAISVAGQYALSQTSKPAVGDTSSSSLSTGTAVGAAGISTNALTAFQQVPGVRGEIRVSAPLLARPFTMNDGLDQTVYFIMGVSGQNAISSIKINDTDSADMPAGTTTLETREGWLTDPPLTLITQSVFEEAINLPMSKHRLETDQTTIVQPESGSYPKPQIERSARNAKKFRFTIGFGGGLSFFNSSDPVMIAFRLRIRRVGDVSWTNLPELQLAASVRAAWRQEIWLKWGNAAEEAADRASLGSQTTFWPLFYYKNSEWQAHSYFSTGELTAPVTANCAHIIGSNNGVSIYLDEATFPIGTYDVEITRSLATATSGYTASTYNGGLFTSTGTSGGRQTIPAQSNMSADCAIESYTTFRDEYPIVQRGLTLVAAAIKNIRVNSLSAIFSSYAPIWNGSDWNTIATTSNPAALYRDCMVGSLNPRPIDLSLVEDQSTFYDKCVAKNLSCNHVTSDGTTVEKICTLVTSCGDAAMRRSSKWGSVIDEDRSAEGIRQMFSSNNMTSPLTITRKFITGAQALIPVFKDIERDYATREFDLPVFDGTKSDLVDLADSAPYDGYVYYDLVDRRAHLDLRRLKFRLNKYSWGVHLAHLNRQKGDLVGLSHDMLIDTYATGRVRSFSVRDGKLISVTINTSVADAPVYNSENIFDPGTNPFRLANVFALGSPAIGMQIELLDNTIATIPVGGVEGRTLFVKGDFVAPANLERTCLVAIGATTRESRRVIISNIMPSGQFFANVDAVDEASQIFAGLFGV